jgi:hypothetical protein
MPHFRVSAPPATPHGFGIYRPEANAFIRTVIGLLLCLLCIPVYRADAGDGWFPRTGRAAVHQRCLDLEHPAVAMVVALQPGYEDLPLLAYLRMEAGVRTVTVFLTNGEGTPGDSLARYPLWMTGVRKEEADRVASSLGSEAWFANLPDAAGVGSAPALAALWDTVGIATRLTRAIRMYQPDVIILSTDQRATRHPTLRESVAREALVKAMKLAASARDTVVSEALFPWSVERLYLEEPAGRMPPAFQKRHPVWRITSLAFAAKSSGFYHTLRLQIPSWTSEGRTYVHVQPDGRPGRRVDPETLAAGVPAVPPVLQDVKNAVSRAIHSGGRGLRTATLSEVAGAIESTEHVLALHRVSDFSRLETRLLVTWKNGLEDLRSSILGVTAQVVPSESLLTTSQLWFLNVKSLRPRLKGGTTDIIFPRAMKDEWTINEKSGYHYPLKTPVQFRILTPAELPFVLPVDLYGLRQPQMTTTFPYLIVHKDPVRERSFIYRGVISFLIGPRRSFVVRTPLIYDDRSSPVIFEMQNFSRDAYSGVVSLSDSSGETVRWPVEFKKKDEVLTDTLYLADDAPAGDGSRLCTLELSGRGGMRSITARRFTTAVDSAVKVLVLSTIDSSPVPDALRVLRQPYGIWRGGDVPDALTGEKTLLIDRDVLADPRISSAGLKAIGDWVRRGGRAIIFPQHGGGAARLRDLCGLTFGPIEPLPPDAKVDVVREALSSFPNTVTIGDWEGWVESRAYDEVDLPAEKTAASIVLRSGRHVLLSRLRMGEGSVTLVAVDLLSQLVNYHPGGYRLLANIIADRENR